MKIDAFDINVIIFVVSLLRPLKLLYCYILQFRIGQNNFLLKDDVIAIGISIIYEARHFFD
jgi:hypothetical protein